MPRTRQEQRSEDTKRAILSAAGQLFAERGFDAVTMREIAKAAGCSHTTIYLYFRDKEALLHHLSIGPLEELRQQVEAVSASTPEERLKAVTGRFVRFCLLHRNMYNIFFMTQASRVDEAEPQSDVNKMRVHLFALLQQAIQDCLPHGHSEEQGLAYARIYFYTLHGMVGTYADSEEPYEELIGRLESTFELAADVLAAGFKQTVKTGS